MRLADVIGHQGTIRVVSRLLAADAVPQTIIFEGRPGIGRRTLAEALSQALLCLQRQDGDACGACQSCRLVMQGDHPDLVQLPDAASLVGLDVKTIREQVIEQVWQSPLMAGGRVFIIPSVERLRHESANALLKVLEEPPAGVRFMMTTGHASGLLPTIRSRSQIYRLTPLTVDELQRLLVSQGLDQGPARRMATMGGGSHRGALGGVVADIPLSALRSLLEQGFDIQVVNDVIAALDKVTRTRRQGTERNQEQRRILDLWLEGLLQDLRQDLRGSASEAAVAAIETVLELRRDLAHYLPVRLVVEGLGVCRSR